VWESISDKISSIFEGLIQFLFESLLGPFLGLDSLEGLIFNNPESAKNETLIWDTFTESEYLNGLGPLYTTMLTLAGFAFVIAIILAGMRISSSGHNPLRRNEMFEFAKEILLVAIGFYYLPTLYDILFTVNSGIVEFFKSMMNPDFKVLQPTADINNFGIEDEDSGATGAVKGVIGTIIIQLALLGLSIWANFYYMMRKLTLLILMGMGPLMLAFWMVPQLKSITGAWLKELIGSIFVNSIHAFVFFAVSIISGSTKGVVASVILYIIFIPVSESIRGLLGMGGGMQGGLSRVGAMFGMGALAGMAGAVKGAMKDKSVTGAIREMAHGVKSSGVGKNSGDEFAKDLKEESFADSQTAKMLKAGEIFSKGGKAVFGMAGAIAGSPLGPLSAIAGAEIASRIGSIQGGVTGRLGAATVLGAKNQLSKGKEALEKFKDTLGNEDDVMIDALAKKQADNWANNSREQIMEQLRQEFPSATPQDLEKKFNDIKKAKLESFREDASHHWKNAKNFAAGTGDGAALVRASAESMAQQWAKNNEAQFMEDFEKTHPINPGESEQDYAMRKKKAFAAEVGKMKERFLADGNAYVREFGGESGIVSRESLASFMANKAAQYADAGNVNNLQETAIQAMERVQGADLFERSGKPNMPMIANCLAAVKTGEQGKAYIQEMMDKGMTLEQAQAEWKRIEPGIHQENVKAYSTSDFEDSITKNINPLPQSKAQEMVKASATYAKAVANFDGISKFMRTVQAGANAAKNSFGTSMAEGQFLTAIPNAFVDGAQGAAIEHISQHDGDAVQAHNALVRGVGYTAGVIFGAEGMKKAQKALLNRLSPYTQPVQQQISSPSEVIEMAQKIRDDNGFEQIPAGAIRQVITRNQSYVEVRTNSGEVRTVSRIGAGNASLKPGEVVYRDLVSEDGITLTPVSKGASAFYRVDSGGARIPANIYSAQNPLELLGNPSHPVHSPVQRKEIPVLNQRVDMGNFYIEDLKNAGMSDIQVVIDKERQFVTAKRDGITYRVSPIMRGNANLASNQVVTIPVEINKGHLVPKIQLSEVSMQGDLEQQEQSTQTTVITQNIQLPNRVNATRQVIQPNVQTLGKTTFTTPKKYYDEKLIEGLMRSKYQERAERMVQRRKTLDIVRRKQGF